MKNPNSIYRKREIFLFVFLMAVPEIISSERFFYVINLGGIYAIICTGLSLLIGHAGQISLGHGAFVGMGAYITALLTTRCECPPFAALVASTLFTTIPAYVLGRPILRLKGYFLALATLGLGEIFLTIVIEARTVTNGVVGIFGLPYFSVGGFAFDTSVKTYYLVIGILASLIVITKNLTHSRPGRALRAISEGEDPAATLGIHVARLKLIVFVLSAAFAGLGGSLLAFYSSATAPGSFTLSFSILLVMMVVIGGSGNIYGPACGAIAVTWLNEAMSVYQEYSLSLYAVVLILCLLFMPEGVTNALARMIRALHMGKKGFSPK